MTEPKSILDDVLDTLGKYDDVDHDTWETFTELLQDWVRDERRIYGFVRAKNAVRHGNRSDGPSALRDLLRFDR